MRCSSKVLLRKFNQIRKQNWSAPAKMSVFIIICMLCIFSLESLGLLHKEKNLNFRVSGPESSIKLLSEEMKTLENQNMNENSIDKSNETSGINGKHISEISKIEKENGIKDILLTAASYQVDYDYYRNSSLIDEFTIAILEGLEEESEEEEELAFFDI